MRRRRRSAFGLAVVAGLGGCGPIDDEVFVARLLHPGNAPVSLREDAGAVEIPLRLASAASGAVSARYRFEELEAQSACQSPDFLAPSGRVTWGAGAREAFVSLLVVNDELAELDERLTLTLDDFQGTTEGGSESVPLVIVDDDRSGIVEAALTADAGDQAEALQAALVASGALGRGVVEVAPGDYELSSVTVPAGTTLSGRGARLHRPANATETTVGVTFEHSGDADSEPSLLEGLTLDGRRDSQGAYQDDELSEAHLVALLGDPESAGRLRVTVESVRLQSGTASGVFLGPGVDAVLCRLQGENLWRDVVTLRGGAARVDAREIDASATEGTTGLWFDGQPAGFGGSHRIEVAVQDTRLASGDLEIEAYGGSVIELERFSMTRGPLRLQAPDATVRISDSVLQTGIASDSHNFFGLPHDVTLTRTTLTVSETDDLGLEAAEADRTLPVVTVRYELSQNEDLPGLLPFAAAPHRLVFDQCTFLRGAGVEATDTVFAVDADDGTGTVVLRQSTLDATVQSFGPGCTDCESEL